MKKSKLLLVALAALPLAACSSTQSQTVANRSLSQGSKITKELVKANLPKPENVSLCKKVAQLEGYTYAQIEKTDFEFVDKDGVKSLYSMSSEKILASKLTGVYKLHYVTPLGYKNFGTYITVEGKNDSDEFVYYTFSANGTLIHQSKVNNTITVKEVQNGTIDCISFAEDNAIYYFNGKEKIEPSSTNIDKGFQFFSMEDYGRPEYELSFFETSGHEISNAQLAVKKGDEVKYYKLPFYATPNFYMGDYLIYFQDRVVSDYSSDYQYERDGKKHNQVIGRFNYTTGKYDETILDYYINVSSSFGYLFDEEGHYTIGYATLAVINEDKTLSPNATGVYIVDQNLKVYDDVTPFCSGSSVFSKCQVVEEEKDWYIVQDFGYGTVEVFDQKLNEIAYFSYSDIRDTVGVVYTQNANLRKGIVNYRGEIICPQTYQTINEVAPGRAVAFATDGKVYELTYTSAVGSLKQVDITSTYYSMYNMNGISFIEYHYAETDTYSFKGYAYTNGQLLLSGEGQCISCTKIDYHCEEKIIVGFLEVQTKEGAVEYYRVETAFNN